MADREKVIRGLETCRTRVNCKECPYAYDKRANDSYCESVLHNDVLALLKEQEAVVRCKDCKYWYKDECSHLCKITGYSHPANWFCADGESKQS